MMSVVRDPARLLLTSFIPSRLPAVQPKSHNNQRGRLIAGVRGRRGHDMLPAETVGGNALELVPAADLRVDSLRTMEPIYLNSANYVPRPITAI